MFFDGSPFVNTASVAIVGAGPYGLSIAAHLAAIGIEHRIFGRPMQFWSKIATAGDARYLKSFCFGTNISTPAAGFAFADYSRPRGLETFEPCSIADFANYGLWFQEQVVPWVEHLDVTHVSRESHGFALMLANGERCFARYVVVATGLSGFAHVPPQLSHLPPEVMSHTSEIKTFSVFKDRSVAVIGSGQSALEAAALLHEAGAQPQLVIRDSSIAWHTRSSRNPSLWRRLRSPVSGLGTGPKAWALTRYPGAMHHLPASWRTKFVKTHLPPEGAWWLRPRVEGIVPVRLSTTVVGAHADNRGGAVLTLRQADNGSRQLTVDHLIAGTGYVTDVDRLGFLDAGLRSAIRRVERTPKLTSTFQSSVPGLWFVGPTSAMSFGPLFRFVVGAEYTARVVSADVALREKNRSVTDRARPLILLPDEQASRSQSRAES
jgi:FAD-dependent urate hydroxylase